MSSTQAITALFTHTERAAKCGSTLVSVHRTTETRQHMRTS